MSQLTRKRVRWLVGVALLIVPLDIAVVALLLSGGTSTATNWAARMTSDERLQAATEIDKYPLEYRLELLKVLSPAERADTWRGVLKSYEKRHPALTTSQRDAISDVRQLLTPEMFSGKLASEQDRATYNAVAERVTREIGRPDATVLFRTMGPSDTSTDALPWRVRVAQWLQEREQSLDRRL